MIHRLASDYETPKMKNQMGEIIYNIHDKPLVFPVHPGTKQIINELRIEHEGLHILDSMSYLVFSYLVERLFAVVLNLGGIFEETTVMGTPCLIFRDTTEYPVTIAIGTNQLIVRDFKRTSL